MPAEILIPRILPNNLDILEIVRFLQSVSRRHSCDFPWPFLATFSFLFRGWWRGDGASSSFSLPRDLSYQDNTHVRSNNDTCNKPNTFFLEVRCARRFCHNFLMMSRKARLLTMDEMVFKVQNEIGVVYGDSSCMIYTLSMTLSIVVSFWR
jgi:hypothetical protein